MAINTFPGSPFQRALAAGVQANVPVGVIGEPGQGKTATMESATSGWGRHVETVIGSNREATDFLGVMIEDEGAIKYSSFQWIQNLNRSEKGLLLLDEFNTSAPSTMKGMLGDRGEILDLGRDLPPGIYRTGPAAWLERALGQGRRS